MLLRHRPILDSPPRQRISELQEMEDLNPGEKRYWDGLNARFEATVDKEDYAGRIKFFRQGLRDFRRSDLAGNGRVALERKFRYVLGHSHECMATFGMTDADDPLARAREFQIAAQWYQRADETVGCLSDYAMRQAESCWGASQYLGQAGRIPEAEELGLRGQQLIQGVFSGAKEITVVTGEQGKKVATMGAELGETVESGAAKAHVVRFRTGGSNPEEN